MANNDTTQDAPEHGREYLKRIGLTDESIMTAGQVVGLLEFFGSIPTPGTNAPTPHTDPAAAEEASAAAAAAAPPAPGAPAAAAAPAETPPTRPARGSRGGRKGTRRANR